jgi:hypothetical protein
MKNLGTKSTKFEEQKLQLKRINIEKKNKNKEKYNKEKERRKIKGKIKIKTYAKQGNKEIIMHIKSVRWNLEAWILC